MNRFICFDLEGPLSPQDNAYELMRLAPHGGQVFEALSRYDDLLTLEGKEGYEPGDTLALIVPFLLYYGITTSDITALAQRAKLVDGAGELVSWLYSHNWQVYCISTSYEPYALAITHRLGIIPEHVASTLLPLQQWHSVAPRDDLLPVSRIEEEILQLLSGDDEKLKTLLDRFFWTEIPATLLGKTMQDVVPLGGTRKVVALQKFATEQNASLHDFVVVGDSITDYKMLDVVNTAGGLAVAFNANEYALPYATVSLASTHLSDLEIILPSWEEGGRKAVERVVKEKEVEVLRKRGEGSGEAMENRKYFHWIAGRHELTEPLEIHRRLRRLVRKEAAQLG